MTEADDINSLGTYASRIDGQRRRYGAQRAIQELISRTGKVIMDHFSARETKPEVLEKECGGESVAVVKFRWSLDQPDLPNPRGLISSRVLKK